MNALIAACWKDDALKQRFLSDPHAVFAEHGMEVPDGMNVNEYIACRASVPVVAHQIMKGN
jgi:hypothetical protein